MKTFSKIINEKAEVPSVLKVIDVKDNDKIDYNQLAKINGGGVEDIDYKPKDKLIDKSPLSKKAKKDNGYRGKKITYEESQVFYKKPLISTHDGVHLYLIDAEYVRDNIDIDYTMGGHGYVYPNYIPENEVWIDAEMNKEDQFTTCIHELTERNLMKNKDMNYSDAHEEASNQEHKVRKLIGEKEIRDDKKPTKKKINSILDTMDVKDIEEYLKNREK